MTIETEERVAVRGDGNPRPSLAWCPRCRRKVEMVTPWAADQIGGLSENALHLWMESETIHFVEGLGRTRICIAAIRTGGQTE